MLTGARKGETLAAKWTEFNLAAGVWLKPSAHTKQKKVHRVPLSAPALALLTEMQAAAKEGAVYVFPGQPGEPLTEIKRVWLAVCIKAGLAVQVEKLDDAGKPVKDKDGEPVLVWQSTVRVHDLRHTYASILASSGMSLPIIGALLGHTQAATTQRYAHLADDPLRAATERVGGRRVGGRQGRGGRGADAGAGVSKHPIPTGRRAALNDPAFWQPLAGLVSRTARDFGLEAEAAGTIIATGLAAGEIGHMVNDDGWIVTPRGAELARLSGFDYDTMIDWRKGEMRRPGDMPRPILVFWPDVERAARGERLGPVIEGELAPTAALLEQVSASKRGPKGGKTDAAARAILEDLKSGRRTVTDLRDMKQEALASLYMVNSRDNGWKGPQ